MPRISLIVVMAGVLVAACGQKGPLFLPPPETPPPPSPAPAGEPVDNKAQRTTDAEDQDEGAADESDDGRIAVSSSAPPRR